MASKKQSFSVWLLGELEQAAAAYQAAPDPVRLAAWIGLLVRAGRREEAQATAAALDTFPGGPPEAALEIYTHLQDWPRVIEAFHSGSQPSALAHHLLGVALSRSGQAGEAADAWHAALEQAPDLHSAAENLADLERAPAQRSGAWPFPAGYWLPTDWLDAIIPPGERARRSPETQRRLITKALDKDEILRAGVENVLLLGDPASRAATLDAVASTGLPLLRTFILSSSGTDDQRLGLTEAAVDAGLLPRGEPLRIWFDGAWQDNIILLNYELHNEPPALSGPVRQAVEEAVRLMQANDWQTAHQAISRSLEAHPNNPHLLALQISTLAALGRDHERDALVWAAAEAHPDDAMLCLAASQLALHNRDFELAHIWIRRVQSMPRMHYSHMRSLCQAQINLLQAKGQADSASAWRSILRQIEQADY